MAHLIQVREGEHGVHAHGILRESTIPYLLEAPQVLDDVEHVLAPRPALRACRVDFVPLRGAFATAVHAIRAAAGFPVRLILRLVIRLVPVQGRLLAVQ